MTAESADSGALPVAVLDADVLYSHVLSDYLVQAQTRLADVLDVDVAEAATRKMESSSTRHEPGHADCYIVGRVR